MSTPGGTGVIAGRRKLFVQDGYISGCVPTIGHGFRRTLVGLKLSLTKDYNTAMYAFQTHPCGVEVASTSTFRPGSRCFRRTLVGLK